MGIYKDLNTIERGSTQLYTRRITDTDFDLEDHMSGEVIFLAITGSTDITITLPDAREGLNYTFINAVSPSGTGDAVITGTRITAMGAGDADADGATLIPSSSVTVEAGSVGGERLEFVSDGLVWFCYAHQQKVGSVTFAA